VTSFPERVVNAAADLAPGGGDRVTVGETLAEFYVTGVLEEASAATWSDLLTENAERNFTEARVSDALGEDLSPSDVRAKRGTVHIRLFKPNTDTTYYFFDGAHLRAFFNNFDAVNGACHVFVGRGIEPFSTEGCKYEKWFAVVPDELPIEAPDATDVRMLVADLTGERRVPRTIGNLLRVGSVPLPSDAYNAWSNYAARTLPLVLANEVRSRDGHIVACYTTPRRVTALVDERGLGGGVFELALSAARWVYTGGAGLENRLVFLTTELSRSWRDDETWEDGLRRVGQQALDAARSAERLFASGKTSDVLKALGDLRKALNDEVSRVGQQTRDLVAALWRDFAIAAAAVAARIAVAASGKPDATVQPYLVLVLLFLIFRLYVVLDTDRRFFKNARDSRDVWTRQTYGFLAKSELDELVERPIAGAERVFWRTAWAVAGTYIVLSTVLVVQAWPWITGTVQGFAHQITAARASTPSPAVTPKPSAKPHK
jgi:hypothetical protein